MLLGIIYAIRNGMLRRRTDLTEHAGHCSRCDAPFGTDDVLYMVCRDEIMDSRPANVPVCEECLTEVDQARRQDEHARPVRCKGCGRQMIACVKQFRKSYCSTRCYMAAWQRRTRSTRPRPTAICICRKRFKPTRSDARYCSDACRQKAYRVRRRAQQSPSPA